MTRHEMGCTSVSSGSRQPHVRLWQHTSYSFYTDPPVLVCKLAMLRVPEPIESAVQDCTK